MLPKADLLSPPRGAMRLDDELGSIVFWTIAPDICATQVQGHLSVQMGQLLMQGATPLYERHARVYGFHNWLAMTTYDSACRIALTRWVLQQKSESVLHIGSASRLVAMGVAVAKVALGERLNAYRDVESLERALRTLLTRR